MSKKRSTETEMKCLAKNKYVFRISDKAITYADEFKQLSIDQYLEGKTPRKIFESSGFDVSVLGIKRVKQCADRWKKAYEKDGIIGLADTRKERAFLDAHAGELIKKAFHRKGYKKGSRSIKMILEKTNFRRDLQSKKDL